MVRIKYRLIPNQRCQSSALVAVALNPLLDFFFLVFGGLLSTVMRCFRKH